MNKRIKELEKLATEVEHSHGAFGEYEKYYRLNTEKFAELIVRECVAQIQPMWDQVREIGPPGGYDYDTFDLAYNDCMNAIKEHFGVDQ
jgi:hypothetical protein